MWTQAVLVVKQMFGARELIFLQSIRKVTTLSKTLAREMKSLPGSCKKKKIRWRCSVRNPLNVPMYSKQYVLVLAVC
jgi:hypothetical protein